MKRVLIFGQIILFVVYTVLSQFSDFYSDIISPLFCLTAFLLIVIHIDKKDEFIITWLLLALMPLSWAIADSLWFVYSHIIGVDPLDVLLVDYAYFTTNLFMLAAVISYFLKSVRRWHRVKLMLDISVMAMIVLGIASGVFFSRVDINEYGAAGFIVITLYITSDLLVILVLMVMSVSVKVKKIPKYLRMIGGAIVLYVIADLLYSFEDIMMTYLPNSLSDILFFVAFLILALAGVVRKENMGVNPFSKETDTPENFAETKLVIWLALLPIILRIFGVINTSHFALILLSIIAYQFVNTYLQRSYMAELLLQEKNKSNDELERLVEHRTRLLESSNMELRYRSVTDGLTGLHNRSHFQTLIGERIEKGDGAFSVLYMDLDRFKVINDVHGHSMGDKVLKAISARLKKTGCSHCEIARIGGDEFGLLFSSDLTEDIESICERIVGVMEFPFLIDEFSFHVGISIGVARYPKDAGDIEHLFQYSDIAMYHAKAQDQVNKFTLYSSHFIEKIERRNQIELLLRKADIERDFELYYQPKTDLKTGEIYGMEALIRWQHKTEGFISPGEFIPIAEETGMILKLSKWVFNEAMQQVSDWNYEYGRSLVVSMNVSPLSLDSYEFIPGIEELIRINEVEPEWLEFEVTEHSAMNSATKVEEVFTGLSNTGVAISVDDFGTGYSSLSYLKRFDLNILKIAKELIDHITVDLDSKEIVSAIILMSKGLGLSTVAEGVETTEQLACLKELGCDAVQGYLKGRPVPAEVFENEYLK